MQVKGSTEMRTIPCDKKSLVDLVHQSLQRKLDDLFEKNDLLHYAWCVGNLQKAPPRFPESIFASPHRARELDYAVTVTVTVTVTVWSHRLVPRSRTCSPSRRHCVTMAGTFRTALVVCHLPPFDTDVFSVLHSSCRPGSCA